MSATITDQDIARAVDAAGLTGAQIRPGPAALASPSYRGLESHAVFLDPPGGKSRFLKIMHPEMHGFFDREAAVALARAAGEAGIAPRVLWSEPETGAILSEALEQGWRTAMLGDLQRPDFSGAVMGALRELHALPRLQQRFDPFARLDALVAQARAEQVTLPEDIGWILALIGEARPALSDTPRVPCRNDGSVSNLMTGPEGRVALVDFDRAGMNDPMYDIGVLLAEMTDFETDMRAPFLAYMGTWDEAAFARARLWAIVDDMIHAVQARICGQRSTRKHLEWLKYGEWRLMRARLALHHPQFEEKIRIAAGEP